MRLPNVRRSRVAWAARVNPVARQTRAQTRAGHAGNHVVLVVVVWADYCECVCARANAIKCVSCQICDEFIRLCATFASASQCFDTVVCVCVCCVCAAAGDACTPHAG